MPRKDRGRRSSGKLGGGLFSSRKRPAAASTPSSNTPAPAPAAAARPPAPMQGGRSAMQELGSAVAEGMAIGTGVSIGTRAVDAIAGLFKLVTSPASVTESTTMGTSNSLLRSNECPTLLKAFEDCLNSCQSEIGKCQSYMDMLSECRNKSSAGLSA